MEQNIPLSLDMIERGTKMKTVNVAAAGSAWEINIFIQVNETFPRRCIQ